MAELLGRANGICGGKGGSMHLTDVDTARWAPTRSSGRTCRSPRAPPGRPPRRAAPARWRSASSATARRTSGPSTRRSTWPSSGSSPSCSSARTTSTWSTRRSADVTAVEHPAADRASRLRARADRRRRQRPRRGPRDRPSHRRPGADGRRSVARGGEDVPPWRALARRPREVPPRRGGRGRGCAGTRSLTYRERLLADGIDADELHAIDMSVQAAIDARHRGGEGRPVPRMRPSLETQLWADGGVAWRT